MMTASNIHYEPALRTCGLSAGGIGAIFLLAQKVGLVQEIDRKLHLLKRHLPYHESDHVLNIAFNILAGGLCLEHLGKKRGRNEYCVGPMSRGRRSKFVPSPFYPRLLVRQRLLPTQSMGDAPAAYGDWYADHDGSSWPVEGAVANDFDEYQVESGSPDVPTYNWGETYVIEVSMGRRHSPIHMPRAV